MTCDFKRAYNPEKKSLLKNFKPHEQMGKEKTMRQVYAY